MAGPIRIAILSNGRQARADIARTAGSLGVISRTASRAGKVIAGAFAVGALVRVAKAVGEVGSSYVSSLNKVQALTGASDRQMGQLATRLESQSAAYAKFGQTTGDAAAGMVELAKSGLSAQKALAAIRGTMTLAKAGELDVADASALVANTLNTFNLKASKAADIANSLANAANISSADVRDVAESFKYVAPLAAKAGISVDQTNAALAELANSGIKASQAGTTMRGMLVALQAPSTAGGMWLDELGVKVYGAGGKMRDFGSILEDLRTGLAKVSDEDANFALKSIFGRNSITGASVLIKGGVKALDQYTRGVQRADAATKLAESASKGLAGSLASIKSQVISTVQQLYRKYSPALDSALRGAISFLGEHKQDIKDMASAAVPALKATGDMITGHVVPALESLAQLAADTAKAFGSGGGGGLAKSLGKDLLNALSAVADIVKKAADALDKLPGPIKTIGAEAVIAALVLPRLTAGVTAVTSSVALNIARLQQWRAEMSYTVTRTQQVSAMMTRLSGAAKTAAGIGGLVALQQSAHTTNRTLSGLEQTAGLAAIGFSVGGPWGAAIGGTVGLFKGLWSTLRQTGDVLTAQKKPVQDYASTLDQVSGAATRATRSTIQLALQQSGAFAASQKLGITNRDLISYLMGNEGAIKRVDRAMAEGQDSIAIWSDGLGGLHQITVKNGQDADALRGALKSIGYDMDKQADKVRRTALETGNLSKVYKGVPKDVLTKIRQLGGEVTLSQLKSLNRQIPLKPRVVRIIAQANNIDLSRRAVRKLLGDLEHVGHATPNMVPFKNKFTSELSGLTVTAKTKSGQAIKALENELRKGKADMPKLKPSLTTLIGGAAAVAKSQSPAVGTNLKQGIIGGFSGTLETLSNMAAAAVHAAVRAAKAAGDIKSPSRKMMEVGDFLGQGLVVGLRAKEQAAHDAGERLMKKLLRGVDNGLQGINAALGRITDLINKRLDGKKQAARRKALLKSLKDERAALVANGRLQDQNNKALEKAVQKYKTLRNTARDFSKSIKGGFVGFGSIVGLGTTGGGSAISLPAILSQLTARANVADQFAAVIEKLRGKLNKTSLRQLLDQAASGDLEGALASASAISSGGSAAITQINQLTEQIASAGSRLGNKMKNHFYGAGLQAAEGLVQGLKKKQRDLDRVAERLAESLVKKVKKALGIKSPSRVFADIGTQTARGLQVGIKAQDGYVKRSGAVMASSLQKGFGTPALDAYMARAGASAAPTFTVQVELTAQQLSEVEKGRRVQISLDAYRTAGGRAKVRTP